MPETTVSFGQIVFALLYVAVFPVILFALAGDWAWPEAWLFGLWFVGTCDGITLYLYRYDPALLAERFAKPGQGQQKRWDVLLLYGVMGVFVAWIVVMPLDARRYHWSPVLPLWTKVLGGACLLVSSFFLFRAFADNTFLSPLVRMQHDRQHRLVDTGVYAVIRHPMYLGALLMFLGTPLLLGSLWGLALSGVLILVLAGRIIGEERMLTQELEGYAAYKTRVRYRLIPYLW